MFYWPIDNSADVAPLYSQKIGHTFSFSIRKCVQIFD